VLLAGSIPNVAELLNASDVFVLPTSNEGGHEEGSPVALLEAMASELPCIASNVAGNRDVVNTNETGILFQPDNLTELIASINKYLKETSAATKIQRTYRKYLVRQYNYYKGYHLKNKCTNETDFYSLDDLSEVPYEQFFAFKDVSGHVYGWDIASLWNLLVRTKPGEKLVNPYNCQPFPTEMWSSLNSVFKLTKVLKINVNFNVDVDESYINSFESKLLSTFQHINSLGNYTDHNWVLNLNLMQLHSFLHELRDIWMHRAGIDNNTRNLICFHFPFVNYNLNLVDFDALREIALGTIINLVYKGQSAEYQQLGAMYVLTALTIVSTDAANSLPWLYASVV
jgi:hypothetical protein